jgi:hypothetical protein
MKPRTSKLIIVSALLAALVIPNQLAAQSSPSHYRIIELPTLGGPTTFPSISRPCCQIITNSGVIGFSADTSMLDPFCGDFPDCFSAHAARWKDGVFTDLGTLPGSVSGSGAGAINARVSIKKAAFSAAVARTVEMWESCGSLQFSQAP